MVKKQWKLLEKSKIVGKGRKFNDDVGIHRAGFKPYFQRIFFELKEETNDYFREKKEKKSIGHEY